jgi:hypothetical protein
MEGWGCPGCMLGVKLMTVLSTGTAGPRVHAQARLLPQGHEAREPALHGARPGQDSRYSHAAQGTV